MRIQVLKDPINASGRPVHPCIAPSAPANDVAPSDAADPNPAQTYLLSLAPGSRRAMTQGLNVIANTIDPGSTADTLDWARVGYGQVVKVRSAMATKYSPAMANKCLAAFRGVLKAAFRLGLIDACSLARTLDFRRVRGERTSKGRCLNADEIAQLITSCDRATPVGIRNAALIAVGFGCGLRRAELVGLDVADVLEGGAALRVRGKGNKERTVFLPPGAQTYLAGWLERLGPRQGPLFCSVNRNGVSCRRLVEQTVYDVIQVLAKKARIEHVSPHDLRRTFVSTLLDHGVSLSTAASMAGHADVSTTSRYDRRGERAKREAARLLTVEGLAQN